MSHGGDSRAPDNTMMQHHQLRKDRQMLDEIPPLEIETVRTELCTIRACGQSQQRFYDELIAHAHLASLDKLRARKYTPVECRVVKALWPSRLLPLNLVSVAMRSEMTAELICTNFDMTLCGFSLAISDDLKLIPSGHGRAEEDAQVCRIRLNATAFARLSLSDILCVSLEYVLPHDCIALCFD